MIAFIADTRDNSVEPFLSAVPEDDSIRHEPVDAAKDPNALFPDHPDHADIQHRRRSIPYDLLQRTVQFLPKSSFPTSPITPRMRGRLTRSATRG
ncbi:MAG TPA: hypothetical protein VN616_13365 [Puia sp.]|nr:hypothetical protein [Puia sp.]